MAKLPLIIDGTSYNINFVGLKRTTELKTKVDGETEDGGRYREMIGAYINYSVSFGLWENLDAYDSLFNDLINPLPYRTITIPTNNEFATFKAFISGVSDEVDTVLANGTKYKSLVCNFTATEPTIKAVGL